MILKDLSKVSKSNIIKPRVLVRRLRRLSKPIVMGLGYDREILSEVLEIMREVPTGS